MIDKKSQLTDQRVMDNTFTLQSTELRDYEKKHSCNFIKPISDNMILVKVSPPIPGYLYDSNEDITNLVLAPRFEGTSLYPKISEWPFYVNICLIGNKDDIEQGPYNFVDIGKLEKFTTTNEGISAPIRGN